MHIYQYIYYYFFFSFPPKLTPDTNVNMVVV